MPYTNPSNPNCPNCNRAGLAILPVRYAVVPKSINATLPAPLGNKVTSVPLAHHQYALRTLRKGYLYIYYEKHPRGSKYKWEVYSVSEQGTLWKQLSPAAMKPVDQEPACSRAEGHNLPASVIAIEKPEDQKRVWLAFSEHPWSAETFEAMDDLKLRDKRMQTFLPAIWITAQGYRHGLPATSANIEQIIEYQDSFNPDALSGGAHMPFISKENGQYFPTYLERQTTRHPIHMRRGQSEQVADIMQKTGEMGGDKQNTPIVIALWDPVGITHELNGYRNDAAGWVDKYGAERELQISALNGIEGVKNALEKRTNAYLDKSQRIVMSTGAFEDLMRVKPNPRGWPQDVKTAPLTSKEDLLRYGPGKIEVFPPGHSEHVAAAKKRGSAHSWAKYEKKLDPVALGNFKRNHDAFLTAAKQIIDQRTDDLIQWLEAKALVDALTEYHTSNIADGLAFEDKVGDMIFGIGSSTNGQKKLDEWVAEAEATQSNLLWRAIALNQEAGMAEVNASLQAAYAAPVLLSPQAWEKTANEIKWNKLADLSKKSLTAFNTQMKALNDPLSGIKPVQSTRGLERIFLTMGGTFLKPFKWTIDTVNEVTLRTLLMVRSGVDPVAAKTLGAWDALHGTATRDDLVRRLRNQDFYLSAAAKAQYEEHAKKWAALRADVEVPDASRQSFNAARDARLALIVAVFEAFNLHKASAKAAQEPGNEKVQAQLTAAKLATSAAAIDVISNLVKGVAGASDKAVSYQALKLVGGGLAAVASGYGARLDFADEERARHGADYRMAILYGIRGFFQTTSAVLTALTALSYCSPLIETFGKKYGQRLAGKALTTVATRLLLARAALVFASLEVSIFILFVSVVIWSFEDNALEEWCDRSAFGAKRKSLSDAYRNADTQMRKYDEALKEAA